MSCLRSRLRVSHVEISELSAQYVLSELGPELNTFPNAAALAAWAGFCPGNNESAGKRKSGRSPVTKHT